MFDVTNFNTIYASVAKRLILLSTAMVFALFSCKSSEKTTIDTESKKGIEQESILHTIKDQESDSIRASEPIAEPKTEINSGPADIDTLIAKMTLREKIGQLFFTSASGYFQSVDDESYTNLVSKIKEYHLGGLIFFNSTVYGQAVLTNKLQKISDIPLWITQDMEYGAAMRISGTTRFVPAMGIAATRNPEYAWWAGKITAREAKAVGVHQIFAPVLDVNNNPDNPVINVRSFSGDPLLVSNFGLKFIEGVESEKIVATAKHFPGHGDTNTDSHLSLPIISYNYSRLDSVELVPFRAAINNGLKSIMTAHIAFSEIGNFPELPATLNGDILNHILTDSLGFKGLVVTDGLEMQGISSTYSPGRAVIQALQAGADLMLLSPDEITAIEEVENAVKNGELSIERIERSVRKLLQWKKEHGLFQDHTVDIETLDSKINTKHHRLIADEVSRKSLTLVRNKDQILPIRASKYPKITVLALADDNSGSTGGYLARSIRDYHPDVTFHIFDKRTGEEEKSTILEDIQNTDLLIIGSFIYVRSGQKVKLSDEQLNFLRKLPRDKPSALLAFGNPYIVNDLPETNVQLLAWAANSDQVRNTVPALFGGSQINGKLPIEIPGMYPIGHGIDLPQTALRFDEPETVGLSTDSLRKIDKIMQSAIFDSTFPGGVVAVIKDGVIAHHKAYGYHTYEKTKKVESSDVFDLASLTKVTATTTAIMKMIDSGTLNLDHPVSKYIPEFSEGNKKNITIRHLLLHNSGLPAFRIYVDSLKSKAQILKAIKNEPLIYEPGTQYVYSDLGFILLGEIIEQVSGETLDRFMRKNFYYPLGMTSTFFNPENKGKWFTRRIPPTQIDTVFRKTTIQGVVNDERAYYLDGVAGHAGLFSNATDLAVFAQMLLSKGEYAGKKYLTPETIKTFVADQSPQNTRGFGFDRKSKGFSSAGSRTSSLTFGHLGFTGTSLWIDPERDMAIILLTNRTWPHRSYGKNISTIRASVADAAVGAIFNYE